MTSRMKATATIQRQMAILTLLLQHDTQHVIVDVMSVYLPICKCSAYVQKDGLYTWIWYRNLKQGIGIIFSVSESY